MDLNKISVQAEQVVDRALDKLIENKNTAIIVGVVALVVLILIVS